MYISLKKIRIAKKLCIDCGNQLDLLRYLTCNNCRLKNNERIIKRRKAKEHICSRCGARPKYKSNLCLECIPKARASDTRCRLKKRLAVIDKYGGKCICCGNKNYKILQLDHINNDGKEHRKTVKNLTHWAFINSKSEILQLLCANCHFIKTNYGSCTTLDHVVDFSQ